MRFFEQEQVSSGHQSWNEGGRRGEAPGGGGGALGALHQHGVCMGQ